MQPLFQQGTAISLRLVLLMILSIAIMTVDHRFHQLQVVRVQMARLIYPLQWLVNLPADAIDWGNQMFSSHAELLAENQNLKHQELISQARLQKLTALEAENLRLRELLRSSSKLKDTVLVAELLAVDIDPYRRQVIINKGSEDGVFNGQPVIDAHGVMGQIIQVNPNSAMALLISDPNHAVPVQLTRTGLRTVAAGTGKADVLELLFIPNTADVRIGDQVVTSGLGGRFPRDYPVGIVTTVEHPPGQPFAKVMAAPSAELDRSREVLLVWHGALPATSKAEQP